MGRTYRFSSKSRSAPAGTATQSAEWPGWSGVDPVVSDRVATCRACDRISCRSCGRRHCTAMGPGATFSGLLEAISAGECPLGRFER